MALFNREVAVRVVSAAVLIPIVLAVVWIGGWPFVVLCLAVALLMAREWLRLTGAGLGRAGLLLAGIVYIGVPVAALIWLRGLTPYGRDLVLALFAVVWATDTGAFFVGRILGGPKLAPRISPNKTWSGAIGGLAAGVLAAIAVDILSGWLNLGSAIALALLVAVVAEVGDLVESMLKRRFKVKDAGALIPGHGGALDRLDSMLLAAPALALVMLLASK